MENNSQEKKQKFLLQTFAVVATLITPYAYLLGISYNQGYLEAFGVSADFTSKGVADVYVDAYVAFGAILNDVVLFFLNLTWKNYLGIFLILVTIFLVSLNFDSTLKEVRSKLKKIKCPKLKYLWSKLHPEKNSTTKAIIYSAVLSYLGSLLISLLLVVLIFWWGLPLWAINKGKVSAEAKINTYLESEKKCGFSEKTSWNSCVKIIDKDNKEVLYEGILVAKNGNEVAVFNEKGSTILKLDNQALIVKARK